MISIECLIDFFFHFYHKERIFKIHKRLFKIKKKIKLKFIRTAPTTTTTTTNQLYNKVLDDAGALE